MVKVCSLWASQSTGSFARINPSPVALSRITASKGTPAPWIRNPQISPGSPKIRRKKQEYDEKTTKREEADSFFWNSVLPISFPPWHKTVKTWLLQHTLCRIALEGCSETAISADCGGLCGLKNSAIPVFLAAVPVTALVGGLFLGTIQDSVFHFLSPFQFGTGVFEELPPSIQSSSPAEVIWDGTPMHAALGWSQIGWGVRSSLQWWQNYIVNSCLIKHYDLNLSSPISAFRWGLITLLVWLSHLRSSCLHLIYSIMTFLLCFGILVYFCFCCCVLSIIYATIGVFFLLVPSFMVADLCCCIYCFIVFLVS